MARTLSFSDPRLSRRLRLGALLAACAPAAALPGLARAAVAGRLHFPPDVAAGPWAGAVWTTAGAATAALAGALLGPLRSRRWPATFAAVLCACPVAVALALAEQPLGPALSRVDWGTTAVVPLVVGVVVAVHYDRIAEEACRGAARVTARRTR
jgi:peptidoglycan/LPS O-acetylase OafA/YrhL